MVNCKTCIHIHACAAWIKHGSTLYDDFTYSVDNCPHYTAAQSGNLYADNDILVNDCKKFLGLTPYDNWTNICCGDSIFYLEMVRKYGEERVISAVVEMKNSKGSWT